MKRTCSTLAMVLLGALLARSGTLTAQPRAADVALRAAMETETVKGDLKAAIEAYRTIAQGSDKAIAAKALWRMAECYQKLGNAEATKIFEQLVRDFSMQPEAAQARARLASAGNAGRPGRTRNSMAQRQVWTGPAAGWSSAVSPDGRYISVMDSENVNTGYVRIHDLMTGSDRVLSGREPGVPRDYVETSVFSRDGKQVAYSRWREADKRYELWTASMTGDPNPQRLFANERQVVPYFMPTDWSPDGKKLAVLLTAANRPDSIGLFSMADRSLHDLKTIKWGRGSISFSPDGNYLGFSREIGEDGAKQIDVSILATDGSREISVAGHPGRDIFVGWSPDGKTLLFVSNRTGSDALFSIGFADGKVQGAPVMIKGDFGGAAVLGLTRAGGLYYTSRGDASSDIQIRPFDFEAGRWISAPITASGIGQQSNPEWSPDGKFVAYLTARAKLGHRILTIRSQDTGRVRELRLEEGSYPSTLRWSPDGRSLAVGKSGKAGGIYRIDVESGQMSLIVPKPEGQDLRVADWSRDGRTIFYHGILYGDPNGFTLMAKDLGSGRERELIRLAGIQNTNLVSLSPDGTKLYYRRSFPGTDAGAISGNPEGATEFAFIERDLVTGAERELIRRPNLGQPTISPDGRYLATGSTNRSEKTRSLLVIPVAGGEPQEPMRVNLPDVLNVGSWATDSRSLFAIKNGQSPQPEMVWVPTDGRGMQRVSSAGISPFSLRPHPDGRQVAYVSGVTSVGPGEIWVLENFLPSASVKKP